MHLAILTGGGDVAPLNALIHAVTDECNRNGIELTGYLKGWQGLLENLKTRLNDQVVDENIGGTILKSSRINLKKVRDGSDRVLGRLHSDHVDGLIVAGGEDTLSNALLLKEFPKILVSKTIDNDVGLYKSGSFLNDFTLGYPTAGEKIASYVSLSEGLRTTAISHERIIVVESMGMHAGWLALASSRGNPDFIIIPEFPLDFEPFSEKVRDRYREKKNVIIVISEGARWKSGGYISADDSEKDNFGHPRFRGTSDKLASGLKESFSSEFDTRNINAVNPSYLYRSGRPNELDQKAATEMGTVAVSHLLDKATTVFLYTRLEQGPRVKIKKYDFNRLGDIGEFHRFVDESLYDPEKFSITEEGKSYFNKFIPEII